MKRKILLIISLAALALISTTAYIGTVVLPRKIRSLVIQGVGDITRRQVRVGSLDFSVFKGLVLKDLVISEGNEVLLTLKKGSCSILIPALLLKKVVIPYIELESLNIFIERRNDNTLNIADLFSREKSPKTSAPAKTFPVFVYKISVSDSQVNFKDKTFSPELSKTVNNLNLVLRLSLPASAKFDFKCDMAAKENTALAGRGEYKIPQQELSAKVLIKNLSPAEFSAYYEKTGFSFKEGVIDTLLNIRLSNDAVYAQADVTTRGLTILKDKLSAHLNSGISASLEYALKNNTLKFSGAADIVKLEVAGVELVDKISAIKGRINFDNAGLSADKISATVFDIPVEAKIKFTGPDNPSLSLDVASGRLELDRITDILADKFKFSLPFDAAGEGRIALKIGSALPLAQHLPFEGHFDILKATIKSEKIKAPFKDINGRLEFSADRLKWSKLHFSYLDKDYDTQGILNNFAAPQVKVKVSSVDLVIESEFTVAAKLIHFSRFDGRYLNSDFFAKGDLDISDPLILQAKTLSEIKMDLSDLKGISGKFKDQIEKAKLGGVVGVKINLSGNINDVKSCLIQANLSGDTLTAGGLKTQSFSMDYRQENGVADIPAIHFSLYDGTIDASAKINLDSENQPFFVNTKIREVKLEKFKLDTAVKEKDIAGNINIETQIKGFLKAPSRLTGTGRISVSEGKLWDLNLLQGLGKVLFAKDFASINIKDAGCDFLIQERIIATDNLKMKGDIIDLSGSAKIGFDSSIDAALNVHVNDEMVPLSGTFKDVTTAIIGEAGRFGTIRISGTLKEPKYEFRALPLDVFEALKNTLFGR